MTLVDFTMTARGDRPSSYVAAGAYEAIVYLVSTTATADVETALSTVLATFGVAPVTISYCAVAFTDNADWCAANGLTGWYAWGYRR